MTIRRRFSIKVKKELYLAAPPGRSIWAQAPAYARPDAPEMTDVISITRRGPVLGDANPARYYYTELARRRHSTDNGRTWEDGAILADNRSGFHGNYERFTPLNYLDPDNGRLLSLTNEALLDCAGGKPQWYGEGNLRARTMRIFYEISHNGSRTWTPARQVIHRDPQYNARAWMPGLAYGVNGAMCGNQRIIKTGAGTLVIPITVFAAGSNRRNIQECDHQTSTMAGFLLGQWTPDMNNIEWECSGLLDIAPEERPSGLTEPDVLYLGGQRIFATMRNMGNREKGIPSLRMCSLSGDGGRTWSPARPLAYEDRTPVWVPACPSEFLVSPRTGRIYWIANIQPAPVYRGIPRYPLTIAEFDPDNLCIVRDSVQTVYDKPPDAPPQRRYSNWGSYIDRETGEFVLTLPEEPKTSWDDYTGDAVRFRIALDEW